MNIVEYIIKFRDQGVNEGLKKAEQQAEKVDKSIDKVNKRLSTGTVLAVAAASTALVAFVGSSLRGFDQQEKALAQVQAGIVATNGVAGKSLDELAKKASALQNDTLFGDEQILQNVTAQLLTFTSIAGEQFDRTQKAALDLATRLGGDLQGSAIQLGKALNDPIMGISALGRSGIQFTVEINRLADAQNLILDELEKQYGGSAVAAAKAGTGGLKQLNNTLGDIKESIGGALLPIINQFAGVVRYMANLIQQNEAAFRTVVQILGVLAAIIGTVVVAMRVWIAVQTVLNVLLTANPIGLIIIAIAALVAGIVAAYNHSETFRGILNGLWNILKGVWVFLKSVFTPIFVKLGEVFRSIGQKVRDFLQKPIELAKNAFLNFITFLEKIPGIGKMVKNLKESFSDGFKQGVEEFRKEQEKTKLGATVGVSGVPGVPGTGVPGTAPPKATTPGTVQSSAPKQFNINITNLVREFTVTANNTITESAADVKEKIQQALLEALADIEISR